MMDDGQSEAADPKYVSTLNPEFGDAGDFWNRYEDLAGNKEREMSKDLNGNLDTLLIFAGLFSAINTAFISFTMPSLSPGSFDRTNELLELVLLKADNGTFPRLSPSTPFSPDASAVLVNCLLYASLCCSLLAAAGAMFGKEWLRNLEQKGQVASLGEQARLRQKKFTAVQRWYFRESIQLLPDTLLLSLVLFFAGLVPYLIGINKAVARIVIGCIACGVSVWIFTICSCVLDRHSPYQTFLTYFIHNFHHQEEDREGGSQGVHDIGAAPHLESEDTNAGTPQSPPSSPKILRREPMGDRNNVFPLNPSRTYDGNGPGPVLVSSFAPSALPAGSARDTLHPTRRGSQRQSSPKENERHKLNAGMVNWFLEITSEPNDLQILAQNLCCLEFGALKIILQDSASWKRLLHFALDALQRWRDSPGPKNKLEAECLGAGLCRLLMDEPRDGAKWREVRRQFKEKLFQSTKSSTGGVVSLSVLQSVLTLTSENIWQKELEEAEYDLRKVFLQTQIERRNERWTVLVEAIRVQHDDIILNLLAALISAPSDLTRSTSELAIKAYKGENLVQHLADALTAHGKVFDKISDHRHLYALSEIYAALMQKVQPDHSPLLAGFIHGLIKQVDVSKPCSITWIRSAIKVVATIAKFEIDEKSRDAIYEALDYIIAGSKTCQPEMDNIELEQFTLPTLNAIARSVSKKPPVSDKLSVSDQPPKSLNDFSRIVPHLVSAAEGLDKRKWLTYFAKNRAIWMPTKPGADQPWKDSDFISNLLGDFKAANNREEQEELALIMGHIANSESDWCTQLISNSGGLAQVVEESIASKVPPRIPVVIALRPLLEIFAGHPKIDWGTDMMYGIVRNLSISIMDKGSGLLQSLREGDSGVNVATLIKFIQHVKGRRTYEDSYLETIKLALDHLAKLVTS
ncbi:hypothetical protein FRC00_004255 [Tulasnella sp. 408]|nr:hypothetical protein FRC00_004255 [Tulasnella sp. 408]